MIAEECVKCPRKRKLHDEHLLAKIQHYITLQDGLCQVGRYELNDIEWHCLAALREEREKLNGPKPEDYGWVKVKNADNG